MRIIAQGHESIFLLAQASLAMVFARYPRAYAVAGWQHTQAQGPEVAFRGCNPIGVHPAFGCQSYHPGEAGTSQPTRPFPRGTIKERQVASRASQTLGTRLGGPLSTHCGRSLRSDLAEDYISLGRIRRQLGLGSVACHPKITSGWGFEQRSAYRKMLRQNAVRYSV